MCVYLYMLEENGALYWGENRIEAHEARFSRTIALIRVSRVCVCLIVIQFEGSGQIEVPRYCSSARPNKGLCCHAHRRRRGFNSNMLRRCMCVKYGLSYILVCVSRACIARDAEINNDAECRTRYRRRKRRISSARDFSSMWKCSRKLFKIARSFGRKGVRLFCVFHF